MLLLVQITSLLVLTLLSANAVKPPGYVKPPEIPDENPPKYEYGYNIEDAKGTGQGKLETRDGIYALGRYYVQGTDAKQSVQYYADDWGYHPLVEYSNVGPHSKSRTSLLLGVEAAKAVATNKFAPSSVPANQHVAESIQRINQNKPAASDQALHQPPAAQPQQVLIQHQQSQPITQPLIQQQPQQVFIRHQQYQPIAPQLIQQQPQQLVQQQPQQIVYHQQHVQGNLVEVQHQPRVLIEDKTQQQQSIETSSQVVSSQEFDEASISGSYGAKINVQNTIQHSTPTILVQTSQKLVSGEDVLSINGAVDSSLTSSVQGIESTTAKSIVTENNSASSGIEVNNEGHSGYSSTTLGPTTITTEASLQNEPIVVADVREKAEVSSTTEEYVNVQQEAKDEVYSTTGNTVETVSTSSEIVVTEPSTILVTPRPVSTNFLAPITAGIQLQNVEYNEKLESAAVNQKQNYLVDIQKSLPIYLGKYEYVQNPSASVYTQQDRAVENIELGKTLLYLPGPQALHFDQSKILLQQPPEVDIKENFIEIDQHQAQHQQAAIQQVPVYVEKKVPYPVVQTKIVDRPVEVTKYVDRPYPVQVPVHIRVPVTVEKQVPVQVDRIVEKPVTITKIVEKPVHIPSPYPVEKIVEKPVHIPVEVTRYIDRPYPVQVPVAQPYPVERIVEKIVNQPYPVEVRVPYEVKVPVEVEKIVEKQISVPHYIDKPYPVERIIEKPVPHYIDRPYPVEKIVEKPVPHYIDRPYAVEKIVEKPVTHYVDRPYAVEKIVEKPVTHYIDRPYAVEKIVEKPVTHYVDRPYPVEVKVPVTSPQVYAIPSYPKQQLRPAYHPGPLQQQNSYSNQNTQVVQQQQQEQQNSHFNTNPYAYAPTIKEYLPPKQNLQVNNGYLPPVHNDCDQEHDYSSKNEYYTIKTDDYIGLLPPKLTSGSGSRRPNYPRKYRNARSNFNSNPRLEYGFMPPLIPSQEIDESGNPIEKGEKH